MSDRQYKDREYFGGRIRLTKKEELARDRHILDLHVTHGVTYEALAVRFSLSRGVIMRIVCGLRKS